MSILMPAEQFVAELKAALARKDGYIMGATGQDPKKWATTSWWYTQYKDNATQYNKALYWRAHAARVWDCNGMAEGLYKDFSGVDINTKARYNYANWCGTKGTGMIPAEYRVPGAAVFWGAKASTISHVAYLVEPVDPSKPTGDWYLIEARGVTYGVVKTKLLSRKPQYWGLMTKYFSYGETPEPQDYKLGDRLLRKGDSGSDVKELQGYLIQLGFDVGKYGTDGEFGKDTEKALKAFQKSVSIEVDGVFGNESFAKLQEALKYDPSEQKIMIVNGNCWVRKASNKLSEKIGVAYKGEVYPYGGETSKSGWNLIEYKGEFGWVSGKYSQLA